MATAMASGEADADAPGKLISHGSIEERSFMAALMCLEGHYTDHPPMGPKTNAKVVSMVSKTLEKTHGSKEVR